MYLFMVARHMANNIMIGLFEFVREHFPPQTHSCFLSLPVQIIPREPLDELLNGFQTDLHFISTSQNSPIQTEDDLDLYASRVAGTVGELCCCLIFHHSSSPTAVNSADSPHALDAQLRRQRQQILSAAREMGKALQYVNIARDIWVDATLRPSGRVYIPESWLKEDDLRSEAILNIAAVSTGRTVPGLKSPGYNVNLKEDDIEAESKAVLLAVYKHRERLLTRARGMHTKSRSAIESLPEEWGGRKGMRAAIESYMEIGRVMEMRCGPRKFGEKGLEEHERDERKIALAELRSAYRNGLGRATVPLYRRVWVFLSALSGKHQPYCLGLPCSCFEVLVVITDITSTLMSRSRALLASLSSSFVSSPESDVTVGCKSCNS